MNVLIKHASAAANVFFPLACVLAATGCAVTPSDPPDPSVSSSSAEIDQTAADEEWIATADPSEVEARKFSPTSAALLDGNPVTEKPSYYQWRHIKDRYFGDGTRSIQVRVANQVGYDKNGITLQARAYVAVTCKVYSGVEWFSDACSMSEGLLDWEYGYYPTSFSSSGTDGRYSRYSPWHRVWFETPTGVSRYCFFDSILRSAPHHQMTMGLAGRHFQISDVANTVYNACTDM